MKIIFSRKGFDSGSGGFPSPLLPDGRLLPLPIPDKQSPIAYKDIIRNGCEIGKIVGSLTSGKMTQNYRAHLDPDIDVTSRPRQKDWRPLFGQVGAAQGHLRNQGVGAGDLFLFFGLFQDALVNDKGKVSLNSKVRPRHVIWGWLQIEESMAVDTIDRAQFAWALEHPHFHRQPDKSNTVYFAKETLYIPGLDGMPIAGAGIFPQFSDKLQLTAPGSSVSVWKLPLWMFPTGGAPALSYHGKPYRWQRCTDYVLLRTVGRGQEFVLDSAYYPESLPWVSSLFIGE